MGVVELIILALALSMDALAVAICKGLSMDRVTIKKAAIVGLWFGGFQAAMPFLGYLLGSRFIDLIGSFDHWIAFSLLAIIGINMIRESLSKKDEDNGGSSLAFTKMLILAIATSIDALAVGITFACLKTDILLPIILIGIITFVLSALGVKIGNVFGLKYKAKAEFCGGAVLIILGLKILLEHLGVINI